MAYDLVTGDTLTMLRIAVNDASGIAFDLAGMTAKFRWLDKNGLPVERAASVSTNVASYQFAAGEIFAPQMRIELEVTNAVGKIISGSELVILNVREAVG